MAAKTDHGAFVISMVILPSGLNKNPAFSALRPKIKESKNIRALQSIDPVWCEQSSSEPAGIVRTLIERITVRRDEITIQWRDQGMNKLLRETLTAPATETA